MNIYKYLNYRKFLTAKLGESRGQRGEKSALARAAGCGAPFLSQVLNGTFELAPEHALGIAAHWGLSAKETEYWVELVQLARAGTPALRSYHEARLRRFARAAERERLRGGASEVPKEWRERFYASWVPTAIHELTTFPGGRSAAAIGERLELRSALVLETLRWLAQVGLVEEEAGRWRALQVELIAPEGSVHQARHLASWAGRAALDPQIPVSGRAAHKALASFHKSWIFGISAQDYERLRQLLLEHIARCQRIIPASVRSELVCMNLNLFVV